MCPVRTLWQPSVSRSFSCCQCSHLLSSTQEDGLTESSLLPPSGIRVDFHAMILQRQTIQVHVAGRRSPRAGRLCIRERPRFGLFPKRKRPLQRPRLDSRSSPCTKAKLIQDHPRMRTSIILVKSTYYKITLLLKEYLSTKLH